MTKYETPRDEAGRRLCQHCMERTVPESLGTKPRLYCSRNCRQRAYEARRTRQAIEQTVTLSLLRERMLRANTHRAKSRDNEDAEAKSRDNAEDVSATSRDIAASTSRDFALSQAMEALEPDVQEELPEPAVPSPTRPTPAPAVPRSAQPTQDELFEDQADEEEAPRPGIRRMSDLLRGMPRLGGGLG